ncbi:tetratricopeptide repeat protein [Candidatus Magnetobacterium casense]|uniref:tetratricopeptide repeat protein n=1 Tax=Candidatus Magnetobacterium casense TaxID=1455061 RepID=UPI001F2BB08D|nr:tetratricopeptide repeat protein [Candidatus Magnetobacterium casensis]
MTVAALAYSNTLHGPFVFDDTHNIVDNPLIKDMRYFTDSHAVDGSTAGKGMKYFFRDRLFGFFTIAVNYTLGGLDVTGYHLFNITVHIINALLVYWLILLTLATPCHATTDPRRSSIALLCALVFVSHPVQTQAVTYVIQRFASLATLCYLLALVLYVKSRLTQFSVTRYATYVLSILSALAAMKTKEIAFTLPVIIVLFEAFFLGGNLRTRIVWLIPIALTMLVIPLSHVGGVDSASGLATFDEVMRVESHTSRWQYLITQFRVLVTYIRLLLLPVNQNMDYDYPVYGTFLAPEVFVSAVFVLSLFALGIYLYRRWAIDKTQNGRRVRLVSFGIIWFFVTLSVESSIIPIRDVIFEHRLYLPSVGFITALTTACVIAAERFIGKTKGIAASLIACAIVISLSVATYKRNYIWQDATRLWEDTARKSPGKVRPHNSLGSLYMRAGRFDDAIREYQSALTINPNYAETHFNLGSVYAATGRQEEAIAAYQTAIGLSPGYADAYNNLGVVYDQQGRLDEAIAQYAIALRLAPNSAQVHNNIGKVYDSQGRYEEAISEFKVALELKPDYPMALNNLGNVYFKQGCFNEAVSRYTTALEIDPGFSLARQNLELIRNQPP